MVLVTAPLAFILVWAMGSIPDVSGSPCSPQNVSLTISDESEAQDLASTLDCSEGIFTVTWVGSIALSQTLVVADGTSLTIDGGGMDSAVNGMDTTGPLLLVEGGSSVLTLRNLEITRGSGKDGGAVCALTSATVNVVNCIFSENEASGEGGAITARASSWIELTGINIFIENVARLYGGAIWIFDDAYLSVDGASTFFSNTAADGGAINGQESSLVTVQGVANFTGNTAEDQGGAITAFGSSLLSITGKALFSGNTAMQEGGALRLSSDASLIVNSQSILFVNNTAGVHGGAVSMFSSSGTAIINIQGTTEFMNNFAGTNGGAVYIDTAASVVLTFVRLEGNTARTGFGGGLYVARTAIMEAASCSFAFNTAAFGGAVATFSSGLTLEPILYSACTFTDNTAQEDGGGIYSVACYDDLINIIMTDNFAGGSGGALVHSGTMNALNNIIFSRNFAGGDGPAVLSLGAIVEMANCTFSGNTFFCEPGTYLEDMEEGCRLDVVCSRCFGECITSVAEVENEQSVPICTVTPEYTTTLEAGGTVASLVLEKGFYRTSGESLVILECLNEDACVGGSAAGRYCAEGYTGPYCAVCEDKYASGFSYSCKACSKASSQVVNAVLMIGLAIFLLLLVIIFQYLIAKIPAAAGDGGYEFPAPHTDQSHIWVRSATNHLVGTIKVLLVVWQIITQFAFVTGARYPGIYQNFIDGIAVLNLDRGFILSSSCLMESNFYHRLVITTISPFAFVFMLVVTRCIALKRNNTLPRVVAEIDRRHISTLLVVVLLIYSTASTTVFETFGCDSLDDGVDYLRTDYRLECNSQEHRIYKAFAAVMIVVYPIGIPLCLGSWLFINRHALQGKSCTGTAHKHLAPFAELWKPYKPERYFWEIVEFTRRVLLTGIGVFMFPNSTGQIAVILLLAAFFGVVFEVLDPYQDIRDTRMYRAGYVVVLLSIYLALLLDVYVSDDRLPSQDVFSIVLIIVHCMMIVAVMVEGLSVASDACRAMREH